MERIELTEDAYEKPPKDFRISEYLKGTFSMFSGHTEEVKMRFDNSLVNSVIDRFGKDITIITDDEEHFTVHANIQTEQPRAFFSWIFLLGDGAEIMEPIELRQKYVQMLHEAAKIHTIN